MLTGPHRRPVSVSSKTSLAKSILLASNPSTLDRRNNDR
jgi:hypothetical protein